MTVSNRQKCKEIRAAGYLRGETAGNTCCDCDASCGRGWWLKISYEYDEWECWCRDCAYWRIHQYDDFDEELFLKIASESAKRSAFQECCEMCVTPPVVPPLAGFEWAALYWKCTCPELDGIPVTGSSCPIHGLPDCECKI